MTQEGAGAMSRAGGGVAGANTVHGTDDRGVKVDKMRLRRTVGVVTGSAGGADIRTDHMFLVHRIAAAAKRVGAIGPVKIMTLKTKGSGGGGRLRVGEIHGAFQNRYVSRTVRAIGAEAASGGRGITVVAVGAPDKAGDGPR